MDLVHRWLIAQGFLRKLPPMTLFSVRIQGRNWVPNHLAWMERASHPVRPSLWTRRNHYVPTTVLVLKQQRMMTRFLDVARSWLAQGLDLKLLHVPTELKR